LFAFSAFLFEDGFVLQNLIGTVLRPRATMALLKEAPPRAGLGPVLLAGASWAAFSAILNAGGYAPSRPAPLIDGDVHYLAQSFFVTPLFLLAWAVMTATSASVARRYGASATSGALAAPLGFAYGVPLVIAWALPDAILFALVGFDALGPLVRIIGPFTALYMASLSTLAVRAVTGLPWPRATVTALAGLVAQGILAGWALR